jgi:hypothetical protein
VVTYAVAYRGAGYEFVRTHSQLRDGPESCPRRVVVGGLATTLCAVSGQRSREDRSVPVLGHGELIATFDGARERIPDGCHSCAEMRLRARDHRR